MSQLVQAFSSGERAAGASSERPESRAVYAGAVYNGVDMNMGVMAEEVPAYLPAFGSVDDGAAARNMKELTKKCARAQSSNGEAMYSIGREMDELQAGMSSPPSCGGNVAPWNAKVSRLYRLCLQFNRNQTELAKACQSSGGGMNCELYAADTENDGLIVNKCGGGPLSGIAAVLSVPAALAAAAFARLKPD